ncbi:MAG: AMIN domain-containing protein [Terriglobales bacterium]
MLRTLYFRALLSVALLAGPLAAQKTATVEHVVVRGTADAMEVEIQTSGTPVSPNTQAIAGPDRIVVDFPGALPSAELRALTVNRGALKSVRSGLFFSNPPITRIVLDLAEAQAYRISTSSNAVVVKLGGANVAAGGPAGAHLREATLVSNSAIAAAKLAPAKLEKTGALTASVTISRYPIASVPAARTSSASPMNAVAAPAVTGANLPTLAAVVPAAPVAPAEPPKPAVSVSYENGMLSIHAEKATLSQVLFEVQMKTQAEIAIPAGAEQEQVVANLGPGPARDVLGALLNGSSYNFIFVGNELSLQRVILTRREANIF